jgi:hypothetical protein
MEVGKEAGAEVVCETSMKAALDQDWDQLGQREEACHFNTIFLSA